jgi:hypothetical protein
MTDQSTGPERRTILKTAAAMAGIVTAATGAAAQTGARLADVPLTPDNKVTVERRGALVLIGNQPARDPEPDRPRNDTRFGESVHGL